MRRDKWISNAVHLVAKSQVYLTTTHFVLCAYLSLASSVRSITDSVTNMLDGLWTSTPPGGMDAVADVASSVPAVSHSSATYYTQGL